MAGEGGQRSIAPRRDGPAVLGAAAGRRVRHLAARRGDRAIVQGELDVARRGLLPGDTLRLRAEAWDNAPAPHVGRSAEIALRLPSLEELRAALRTATQGLVEAADSIADSQRDLGERTG